MLHLLNRWVGYMHILNINICNDRFFVRNNIVENEIFPTLRYFEDFFQWFFISSNCHCFYKNGPSITLLLVDRNSKLLIVKSGNQYHTILLVIVLSSRAVLTTFIYVPFCFKINRFRYWKDTFLFTIYTTVYSTLEI